MQTKKFFLSMDIPVTDMYGASEAGGVVAMTRSYCHLDSSGKVLSGIESKIDKPNKQGQGEVLTFSKTLWNNLILFVINFHRFAYADAA